MSLTTNAYISSRQNIVDTGGVFATPIVITIGQSGACFLVDDAAGLDFTLPAITSTEVGIYYDFLVEVSITSNSFRVTAQAADLLTGSVYLSDDTAAYTTPQGKPMKPDVTNDLIMTMNGTTTGGKIGTRVRFTAISATRWFVEGVANGSGVLANPFS